MPSTVTDYRRSPTIGGTPFPIRIRVEPTRNTKNAAQPSRKSSHPNFRKRTNVRGEAEFLISVVDIYSLSSEYKSGVRRMYADVYGYAYSQPDSLGLSMVTTIYTKGKTVLG